jgi:cytochrome c oxidase subunit 3
MNPFRHLTEKPWVSGEIDTGAALDEKALSAVAGRNALKLFFAVIGALFLLLTIAYGDRMTWEDWRPLPEQNLLWFNSLALVLSSIAMQWAVYSVHRDRMEDVKLGLGAGGITALVFLAGQLLAWRQLVEMGYYDATNPAIAFFILITGLHGLHIVGGLVAWGRVGARIWLRGGDAGQVRVGLELCTLYWHYLLLVWLVLFGLLFSGNSNLSVLLAVCGLR